MFNVQGLRSLTFAERFQPCGTQIDTSTALLGTPKMDDGLQIVRTGESGEFTQFTGVEDQDDLKTRLLAEQGSVDNEDSRFARVCSDLSRATLGCLSRTLFSLNTKDAPEEVSLRIMCSGSTRLLELTDGYGSVPPRVISKLFVGFGRLVNGGTPDSILLHRLESLAGPTVPLLEPSQVQQICFGLIRFKSENTELKRALLERSVQVTPIANKETHMNLIISLSLISDKTSADWRMFEKIFRDTYKLGSGYVSRQQLESQFPDLSPKKFQSLLNSLKQ